MKIKYHIAFSAFFSGILYLLFRSWILTSVSFSSGIFIDIDHFVDYFIEYGFKFNLKDFFYIYSRKLNKKTYIIFHSWELLFILFIASWLSDWNLWITGVFAGFGQHLIIDHFNEPYIKWLYSFFWRWKKKFVI